MSRRRGRQRSSIAAAVVAAATMLLAAAASAQEGVAVPIPETPHSEPEFIGKRAKPKPLQMRSVPEHPHMAANGESNLHVDAYASDVNEWSGPLGGEMGRRSNGQFAECASLTFDSEGRLVTVCVGLVAPRLELMDPKTLEVLAVMPLPPRELSPGSNPFTEFGGGGYFYLDDRDRAVIPTTDRRIFVVEQTDGPNGPGFNKVEEYDLNPAVAPGDVIVSALPDYSGNIWFAARSGVVGFVDPADGSLHSLELGGEGITNSFALDEKGGVYIVTDRAMYRFEVGKNGEPKQIWREVYPNNGEMKPGQVDDGSGTTPTLMGTDYVAINDNSDPMNVIVYQRRRNATGKREVCRQPIFEEGASATDNSLIATERSIIVENNYGYEGPATTQQGGTTEPGVARIDLDRDGRGCKVKWESDVISPTVVPKLSLGNGLVYVYAKNSSEDDPWYLTAIDFRSGKTVYQQLSGVGLGFNNNYAPATIGPDGSIYVGVLDGLVRLFDLPGQGPESRDCDDPERGTDGPDRLRGDDGNDAIHGGRGNDSIRGRGGHDCLKGGRGADQIKGARGADRLGGGRGLDDLGAGPGGDLVRAGSGGDTVRGGPGGDVIRAGKGRDRVRGGRGADRITGGPTRDRLRGGQGPDRIRSRDGGFDVVHCGAGRDRVRADREDRVRGNCERVRTA